ncbi:homoserine kinase type II [Cellulomonas sp. PhB143]|nr:homoserine kinase type II [Cellulomonas sp. PhB143]
MPVIEMLWETVDPAEALRARFGFRDAASAGRWVATTLLAHWGLAIDRCERIVISDRNALAWVVTPSGRLLAKWSVASSRFAHLSRVARLTAWLDSESLPVSAPLPALDGRHQVELDNVSMSLQRVVDGDLLDVDDAVQVRAAGATLAELHRALAAYPAADELVRSAERPEPLPARITGWLGAAPAHVPAAGRRMMRRLVAAAPPGLPPVQLVHGDFRSSNVLAAGPAIVAVIDFEEVRLDWCIDELARSAVMLGTRFRHWGPVPAEVHAAFFSGYQSVRRLTPVEEHWWDALVLWYTWALVPTGDDPTGWGAAAQRQLDTLLGTR